MAGASPDYDAYLDAAAVMMGLVIAAEHRPGVTRFLGLAAEMAATLDAADLGEEPALAPVFRLPRADGHG